MELNLTKFSMNIVSFMFRQTA